MIDGLDQGVNVIARESVFEKESPHVNRSILYPILPESWPFFPGTMLDKLSRYG
jgi:hypothetical protein